MQGHRSTAFCCSTAAPLLQGAYNGLKPAAAGQSAFLGLPGYEEHGMQQMGWDGSPFLSAQPHSQQQFANSYQMAAAQQVTLSWFAYAQQQHGAFPHSHAMQQLLVSQLGVCCFCPAGTDWIFPHAEPCLVP